MARKSIPGALEIDRPPPGHYKRTQTKSAETNYTAISLQFLCLSSKIDSGAPLRGPGGCIFKRTGNFITQLLETSEALHPCGMRPASCDLARLGSLCSVLSSVLHFFVFSAQACFRPFANSQGSGRSHPCVVTSLQPNIMKKCKQL